METLTEILLPVDDRESGEWLLYPNPTADRLHIVPAYSGNLIIHMLDLNGRLMIEQRRFVTLGNAFTLDCQDFITGTYILELRTPENRILLTRKVLME
ncbi:MAG TPA: T9SS type A sorting domain-containing protein [Saprospiraceae bacterium]|nr:T9SS type A sorting domain-containing protein [Saprospiraceae bacterium]